jgi:hypothetical protein
MPTIQDAIQLQQHFDLDNGEHAICDFYVDGVALSAFPLTNAIAVSLASILEASWNTHLKSKSHANTHFRQTVVTDVRSPSNPQFVVPWNVAGTASGAPLPNAVAAMISWSTALRGRSFRGRSYLPGFTESVSDGNSPDAGTITALEAFADDLIANYGGGSGPALGVASRKLGVLNPITARSVSAKWRTQRRRNGR